jgi:hypothetical protein
MTENEGMGRTTCEHCGTQLEVSEGGEISDWTKPGETFQGDVPVTMVCPNPDCPSNESDLAKAADTDG